MGEHSPLPWKVHVQPKEHLTGMETIYVCPEQEVVSPIIDALATVHTQDGYKEDQANAAYIVQACNAFPALVKALEGLSALMDEADRKFDFQHGTDFAVRVTLAKLAADEALDKAKAGA